MKAEKIRKQNRSVAYKKELAEKGHAQVALEEAGIKPEKIAEILKSQRPCGSGQAPAKRAEGTVAISGVWEATDEGYHERCDWLLNLKKTGDLTHDAKMSYCGERITSQKSNGNWSQAVDGSVLVSCNGACIEYRLGKAKVGKLTRHALTCDPGAQREPMRARYLRKLIQE